MFIGRENELQFLNDAYASDKAEFIMLYGRRRVGKTELLNEFCCNKPCIFYTCREYTDSKQLQSFTDKVRSYNIPAFEYVECFSNWEKAFSSVLHIQKVHFYQNILFQELTLFSKSKNIVTSLSIKNSSSNKRQLQK